MSPLAIDNAFARFWRTYPKRNGSNPKTPARTKFVRYLQAGISADAIVNGASKYADELAKVQKVGTEFVAMAVTWLNQRRWEDYPMPDENGVRPVEKVFIEVDTPAWKAWSAVKRWPQRDFRVDGRYRTGWFFDSELPPQVTP